MQISGIVYFCLKIVFFFLTLQTIYVMLHIWLLQFLFLHMKRIAIFPSLSFWNGCLVLEYTFYFNAPPPSTFTSIVYCTSNNVYLFIYGWHSKRNSYIYNNFCKPVSPDCANVPLNGERQIEEKVMGSKGSWEGLNKSVITIVWDFRRNRSRHYKRNFIWLSDIIGMVFDCKAPESVVLLWVIVAVSVWCSSSLLTVCLSYILCMSKLLATR